MIKCASESTFTDYTAQFKGTMDYFFFILSPHLYGLGLLAVSGIPDKEELTAHNHDSGLPNKSYPSDHIMLRSDMTVVVNLLPGSPMVSGTCTCQNQSSLEWHGQLMITCRQLLVCL